MDAEPPVVKITYAILLSALRKRAIAVTIARDNDFTAAVSFEFAAEPELGLGAETRREMSLPARLLGRVVMQLCEMAQLPPWPAGSASAGMVQLKIGGDRGVRFALRASGAGRALHAQLRFIDCYGEIGRAPRA